MKTGSGDRWVKTLLVVLAASWVGSVLVAGLAVAVMFAVAVYLNILASSGPPAHP